VAAPLDTFEARISLTEKTPHGESEGPLRFTVVGDKARLEWQRTQPQPNGQRVPTQHVSVADGTRCQKLVRLEQPTGPSFMGMESREPGDRSLWPYEVLPLSLHFRGKSAPARTATLERARPTGGRARMNGTACVEYAQAGRSDGHRTTFLVDPTAGSAIRQVRHWQGERLVTQTTIEYRPWEGFGPVPTRWTRRHWNSNGTEINTLTAELRELRRDPVVDATTFAITFPEGTPVSGLERDTMHVAQADGTLVPKAEEPIAASPWFTAQLVQDIALGTAVLAVLIALAWWVRYRLRASARVA
jgi:hypothetical protein